MIIQIVLPYILTNRTYFCKLKAGDKFVHQVTISLLSCKNLLHLTHAYKVTICIPTVSEYEL